MKDRDMVRVWKWVEGSRTEEDFNGAIETPVQVIKGLGNRFFPATAVLAKRTFPPNVFQNILVLL